MAKIEVFRARAQFVADRDGLKFLRMILLEIRTEARARAHGPYATGALARSIRISGPRVIGDNIEGSVGTRKKYAMAVERGASAHPIRPKKRGGKLVFYWRKVGRVVRLSRVSHPGQRGKHYLFLAGQSVALRHNGRME